MRFHCITMEVMREAFPNYVNCVGYAGILLCYGWTREQLTDLTPRYHVVLAEETTTDCVVLAGWYGYYGIEIKLNCSALN